MVVLRGLLASAIRSCVTPLARLLVRDTAYNITFVCFICKV